MLYKVMMNVTCYLPRGKINKMILNSNCFFEVFTTREAFAENELTRIALTFFVSMYSGLSPRGAFFFFYC